MCPPFPLRRKVSNLSLFEEIGEQGVHRRFVERAHTPDHSERAISPVSAGELCRRARTTSVLPTTLEEEVACRLEGRAVPDTEAVGSMEEPASASPGLGASTDSEPPLPAPLVRPFPIIGANPGPRRVGRRRGVGPEGLRGLMRGLASPRSPNPPSLTCTAVAQVRSHPDDDTRPRRRAQLRQAGALR